MKPSKPFNRREFWDKHPGLVWSNPNALDDAFISAALRRGDFLQILDIAVEFGVPRVNRVWQAELAAGELSPRMITHTGGTMEILRKSHERIVAASHSTAVASA